jgi:DNA topoisomerase-1
MRRLDPDATPESASAEDAGLRYVSDAAPGIRRLRQGRGFSYRDADGNAVREPRTLARIRSLAIPPAYRDVWICADPRGHIQATGRDARGRKQYRYHPRWNAARNETKFERMLAFSRALPRLRKDVSRDLRREGLPREKVLAACIRVGNEEYARVRGDRITFEFRGKRGKQHRCQIDDRRVARVVAHCQGLPGEELFQYVEPDGERRSIDSADVNSYLRDLCGEDLGAKDFRTWAATLHAADGLLAHGQIDGAVERRSRMLETVDAVAIRLNNTRAVCRKFYIHPGLLDAFERGELHNLLSNVARSAPRKRFALSDSESGLVAFLRRARSLQSRRAA